MQKIIFIIILAEVGFGSAFALPVFVYSGDFNLPIPANDPSKTGKGPMNDAVIEIPHYGTIHDLEVEINLTHPNAFDLHIYLESPSGTNICLVSYNPYTEFFFGENYVQTVFDDQASIYIKDDIAPFTGIFRPVERLSEFNDEDIYGSWKLKILDAHYADSGTFESFELTITTPEPDTLLLLLMGMYITVGFRPCRNRQANPRQNLFQ